MTQKIYFNKDNIKEAAESLSKTSFVKDPAFLNFREKYVKKHGSSNVLEDGEAAEASSKLTGTVSNDGDNLAAITEILQTVYDAYHTKGSLDFAVKVTATGGTTKIPIRTSGSAIALSTGSGVFSDVADSFVYRQVENNQVIGKNVSFTVDALEDATFDIQSVMYKGAGEEIGTFLTEQALGLLQISTGSAGTSVPSATTAGYIAISGSATADVQLEQVMAAYKALDKTGHKPAWLLADSDTYNSLLLSEKLTSALYNPSNEAMRQGVLPTLFGFNMMKVEGLTGSGAQQKDLAILVADDTIALVTRSDLSASPYENPETDTQGTVFRIRSKPAILFSGSIIRMYGP